ncbi:MAG: PEP/pyruvate-binding domain-containing protein, partial [Blastocatellia bacterium]
GWGIPNGYIKNADRLFKSLEGKYVRLEIGESGYSLAPADPNEVEARQRLWVKRADLVTPPADLTYRALTDLKDQRSGDSIRFGAKSANLGELIHAGIPGFDVPPGFAIPFHYYRELLARNHLEDRIQSAVEEDRFVHDPKYRKLRLAEIRGWIQNGVLDEKFKQAVLGRAHREFPGKGLFVRSSTNSEDLPNFSGAGLYTTVPNVKTDAQLVEAIKTVWASIWNYEAYEARESFGMNHFGVYPAVLVQEGINADSAGVVITTDPFNPTSTDVSQGPFVALPSAAESRAALQKPGSPGSATAAVYINAKRGLGTKVVEGKKVAEQVIFRPASGAIQTLTRSGEDTMLKFDSKGGLKEIKIDPERQVLTDEMVRRLSGAAIEIKKAFHGRDQDIEWVYASGQLYIVQSRPFIESK